MFKNVTFCTRHTGEQRELKTLPHPSPGNRSPSHRVGLLPLLLQPGAPAAPAAPARGSCGCLCTDRKLYEEIAIWGFFFCTHLFKKKKQLNELPCSGVFDSFIGCL